MEIAPSADKEPYFTNIHNVRLEDPYHWLKNKDNKDVIRYLEKENKYTKNKMSHTEDLQDKLFEEMKERIKEDDQTVPVKRDDYYYYSRTEKRKNYKIYCRKYLTLEAEEEIYLDGNILAKEKDYLSIGTIKISPDHNLVAYTIDTDGYETYTAYVKKIDSGKIIDKIEQISYNLEWHPRYKGLFYSLLDDKHRSYRICYHHLNTDRKTDNVIYTENDVTFGSYFEITTDKRYLIIKNHATETDEIRLLDLNTDKLDTQVFRKREKGVEFDIDHHQGKFYFLTSKNAMNFKLCSTPSSKTGEENWEEIIEHDDETHLLHIKSFKDFMALTLRKNGLREIEIIDYDEFNRQEVDQPGEIYSTFLSENPNYETDRIRYKYSSLNIPETDFEYIVSKRQINQLKQEEVKNYNPKDYITKRINIVARDGEKIPLSLIYRKDTNHPFPLYLYGYGSYGFSIDPTFNHMRISLMQRGVGFAIAHVRGGGELGKQWYHDGKLFNKMNTFHDFIDCAKYLIEENYTTREQLIISGGSAGGLLIGAVLNIRSDLFKTAVIRVPFVDLINTMIDETIPLTTFEYQEWGNPKNENEFEYMIKYSPYDNIQAKKYPDILVTAGLNDPRVHFWEPAKYVARLRDMKTNNNLLLLKIDLGVGHSGASGRYEYMKEIAFIHSFILNSLDLLPE